MTASVIRGASITLVLATLGATACAPARLDSISTAPETPAATESRTLVLIGRQEPSTLSATLLLALGIGATATRRPFNAALAMADGEEKPVAYLADALPRLHSDSWSVSPDGRMETIYSLRPNLTWHDGPPLTAADFVFAWQVYNDPDLGTATSPPHTLMEVVRAPDDRTLVIGWRGLFAGAGTLQGLGGAGASPSFAPLPRHLLGEPYQQDRKGFVNLSFWTVDYVGAGPYRLDRWEHGAFIEATAFDGHALGRPRIDRIRMLFNSDSNAALAVLLSGEAQTTIDDSIGLEQGVVLKQDWESRGAGTVSYIPSIARYVRVQFRPEHAKSPAILNLAVRKALAHTIDKQLINESVFFGAALRSDTMMPPTTQREVRVDIPIYPYDVRRAEQLLQGAGYIRDREGVYVGAAEGRLNFEIKNITSSRNDSERTILANAWRQLGIEIEEATFRPAEARDGQALSTFRSLSPTGGVTGDDRFLYFLSANITSAENNWVGSNRGGWANAGFDRLIDQWSGTLEEDERANLIAQAAKVLNEELAVIPLYYAPSVFAFASSVRGVDMRTPTAEANWNMHLWELL